MVARGGHAFGRARRPPATHAQEAMGHHTVSGRGRVEGLGLGRATDYDIKKLNKKKSVFLCSYSKDSNLKQGQGTQRATLAP